MTKENKRTLVLTTIVCLIPIIVGIILYPQMPDTVVTHWDAAGNPNGWSSKLTGTIIYPGLLLLVNLAMPFLLRTDPKYENMDKKLKTLIQWVIPITCIFCSGTTLAAALGREVHVENFAPMFIGLLFVFIGNLLPKTKQSYTLGIKLPWTLNDEENWNKTHRLGGFVFVIAGFIIIAGSFTPWRGYIVTAAIAASLAIPTLYSYILYRR